MFFLKNHQHPIYPTPWRGPRLSSHATPIYIWFVRRLERVHLLLRGLWILYAWPLDNICVADKVNNLTGVRLITLQP